MTDSFDIRVFPPRDGCLQTEIQLGSAPAVTLTLAAAQDELTKLRTWMEDIARGISPALICFADGTALSCRRDYDDETGFAKTERFLDEVYPTSISTFCVRDGQGTERCALIKTKHFLNYLYLCLLTGGNPSRDDDYLPHFPKQWYAHTPARQGCEDYYGHYRLFSSRLLEWYLSCKEALPRRIPRFKPLPEETDFLLMGVDFGEALFWHDRGNCGDTQCLWLHEGTVLLDDIPELVPWYRDFCELEAEGDSERPEEHREAIRQWHIRGLEYAEKIRLRIPTLYVFLYQQSDFLTFGTEYEDTDCGRLIFDERFIETEDF